jgi:hypothetical protein
VPEVVKFVLDQDKPLFIDRIIIPFPLKFPTVITRVEEIHADDFHCVFEVMDEELGNLTDAHEFNA